MPNLSLMPQYGAIFITGYMAGYFLAAWINQNRNDLFWSDWKNLLVAKFEFRLVFAAICTLVYGLWL